MALCTEINLRHCNFQFVLKYKRTSMHKTRWRNIGAIKNRRSLAGRKGVSRLGLEISGI